MALYRTGPFCGSTLQNGSLGDYQAVPRWSASNTSLGQSAGRDYEAPSADRPNLCNKLW